ncbi:hypothetical protein U1E44_00330 [Arenibacter sp. GZD96]|nr:hypothetical protein [Arenibacter sp. GZD-96]MEA1784525.1 hypothetical protein [Arenibacter sp. GZD-96]
MKTIQYMEDHVTFGTKVLNGFLSLMVIVLIGILAAVLICLILAAFGFF